MQDSTTLTASTLRTIAPHFQRSINLTYDAGNADYISGYIPTQNGANAIAWILRNTQPTGKSRAHVLHAPYGSGKSLLSLVLSAIISRDEGCETAVTTVINRLERHYPDSAQVVQEYHQSNRRLLPVILSGDEGSLTAALTRGLTRAVSQLGLGDFRPRTQFKAALETIEQWERLYPDAFQKLQCQLAERGHQLSDFIASLQDVEPEALTLFENIYPIITAGARFDGYAKVSLADAYYSTAAALQEVGFDGIFVIWDEFGRFMEAKAGEAFGNEAALLQTFAEFCNRSGDAQVHLTLVTHRQLSTYASDLPTAYQQEWARIAERFQAHDVTSDPAVVYRLIAEAFETTDTTLWEQFVHAHDDHFRRWTTYALELDLFNGVDNHTLRKQIIEQTWPLHPFVVYALPRLSSQVAQNERTLFTFLAADEPDTLQTYLAAHHTGLREAAWWQVGLETVWDYFAEGIRMDVRPGGTHAVWSGVMYALNKIDPDDSLSQRIVKALGVLSIISDVNTQTQWDTVGKIAPSTELIAWSVDVTIDEAQTCLESLGRRRAVRYRRADGYWTFTRGSDVDLEQEIAEVISGNAPNRLQLRQLLQTDMAPPFHLPRGHNLKRRMTRYFRSVYRWADELDAPLGSDESLKRIGGNQGYADGLVVYVLALTAVERKEALERIQRLPAGRAVYVIPEQPLHIMEPLRELFALRALQNNPQFMAQDDRLPREVDFFIEDAQRRLRRALRPLLDTQGTTWLYNKNNSWQTAVIQNRAHISRLLTNLCETWFDKTPIFNNESLNVHQPSRLQIRNANKVIDHLLKYRDDDIFPFDLGLTGHGPDRLILRTMLVQTGLLQPVEETAQPDAPPQQWQLRPPENNNTLANVWDIINRFLDEAQDEEQEITPLLETLQKPPFGIRQGVLPILLAVAMRPRLQVLTLRQQRKVISPIRGKTFTELCQNPDDFTVEVGVWDERRKILWGVLEKIIFDGRRRQTYVTEQERNLQPLSYLSLGLLRWLQSLPRFSRDTGQLSPEALEFRNLIRQAQREPARVLLYDLLELLESGKTSIEEDRGKYRQALYDKLNALMDEIANAYLDLRYQLDEFAAQEFAPAASKRLRDGQAILTNWLKRLDEQIEGNIRDFRFSDVVAQRFVNALLEGGNNGRFWERMSRALIGISTTDWNDLSVNHFKQALLNARDRLQRELFAISEDEDVIELHLMTPDGGERTYRFRPSALSKQGQFILQNFKSTMAVAGRPLSPDEQRQVALAFLHYILEGDDPKNERKNRSLRRQK